MQKDEITQTAYFYTPDSANNVYDIFQLFQFYDNFFFHDTLQKSTIQWSTRMTLCAGTCQNMGCGSCTIKLSQPLLKYRTGNQLKETILHEMIHAYLFITNPRACLSEGGHGKQFKEIMHNINHMTGLTVTVSHSFKDQVMSYQTHVWRCDGPCRQVAPYFGYVKRSMNRRPQPADHWFKQHQRNCGGSFAKISEPQKPVKQKPSANRSKSIQQHFKEMQNEKENRQAADKEKEKTRKRKLVKKQIGPDKAVRKDGSKWVGKGRTIADYIKDYNSSQNKSNDL